MLFTTLFTLATIVSGTTALGFDPHLIQSRRDEIKETKTHATIEKSVRPVVSGTAHPTPHQDPSQSKFTTTGRNVTSTNWCGPVTGAANITSVEATWTVPTATLPAGGDNSTEYWFYQWVGIDGTNGCDVLPQGGTGQTITNGEVRVYPWYEFWPSGPVFPDMAGKLFGLVCNFESNEATVNSGDRVYVKVYTTNDTAGSIYIENYTTGESNTYNVTSDHGPLCYATAEWIAEDPSVGPEAFPAFTSFEFNNCTASTTTGEELNASGADWWVLFKDNERLCHAEGTSVTDVSIFNS